MSTNKRRIIVERLRLAHGNCCFWCGLEMDFINYGTFDPPHENTVSIEHHIAKINNKGDDVYYLRLAHRGCNILMII